jgi:hypothetical protein
MPLLLNMSFVKVEFGKDDQRDPFNWNVRKKWLINIVACVYTGFVGECQRIPPHISLS